jgi:hypothetical protein
MLRSAKYLLFIACTLLTIALDAQSKKPVYHPCFLLDSVEQRLDFIKANASRIFVDTFDCKETLLDSISVLYVRSKDKKYLDALAAIRQNPYAKVEGLYIDVIKKFVEDDFSGFLNQLYLAKGKYAPLERELIATMNMIMNGRPYKQKYMGLLGVEISKAQQAKDNYRAYYLQKLKTKIEDEKY